MIDDVYYPITLLEMHFLSECTNVRSAKAKIKEIKERGEIGEVI